MPTITTSTQAQPVGWPGQQFVAYSPDGGDLYAMVKNSAGNYELNATDPGGAWFTWVTLTRANLVEMGPIQLDKYGWLHWCYRTNEGSEDKVFYRRIDTTNPAPGWGSEYLVSGPSPNGGVAGTTLQGLDLFVHRRSGGGYRIIVAAGATTNPAGQQGVWLHGLSEDPNYVGLRLNNSIITGNRNFFFSGTGRMTPALDVEHTGDGLTSSTPHMWVSFGRTAIYQIKLTWNGNGWTSPSSAKTIATGLPAHDYMTGRWDRARFNTAVISPSDTTRVRVYERNQANTTTTTRDTPIHPTGVVRQIALGYDSTRGDLRVYAVGTSNATVYQIDYSRTLNAWTAWVQVSATAVVGTAGNQFGVRRGTAWDSKYDYYSVHATPSPNTVLHTQQTVTYTPFTPTWSTNGLPYTNGAAADVAAALTLDWIFSDPDPADTQSAYALSRQVGGGALQYWRASDSTWQATEQKNTSSTSAVTLAAGWALASDAAYTFRVKVWDSADVASPSYSTGMVLIPSAKANPTVSSPTAAQVLTGNSVTVVWSVAEQSAYRVTLSTAGGALVHDSGWLSSTTATSYTPPTVLADGSAWTVTLQTKNAEGLASTLVSRAVTVDYIEPAAPALTLTPLPLAGIMRVTATNPAPTGAQPAVQSQELWRRPRLYLPANANTSIEAGTTGWAGTGGTMTSSGTQKHDGALALRLVPTGAAADSYVASTAVTVDPTVQWEARAWIRPDTANKSLRIWVRWQTSGGADVSTTSLTYTTPTAGVWHYVQVTGAPPATTGRAQVAVGLTGTPAAGDAFYADEILLVQSDASPGVRIAQGLGSGSVVDDWGPTSITDWEYRLVVYGANSTVLNGPWTA